MYVLAQVSDFPVSRFIVMHIIHFYSVVAAIFEIRRLVDENTRIMVSYRLGLLANFWS